MDVLHPIAVHLPIALVLLAPVIDALGFFTKKDEFSYLAIGFYGLAILVSLFATATGQAAFDTAVAQGVEGKLLNTHADDANLVPWLLIVVLVIRVVLPKKIGKAGRIVALVAGVAMWPFIYQVGASGGELVYEHAIGIRKR